jgi:hypothetical protein
MSSKVLVALTAAAVLAAPMSSAFASCLTPNEQRADQVRALQTELMVGALKCGNYDGVDIRATYNAFVTKFTPQLVVHSEVLKAYFRRDHAATYQADLDSHVTKLANVASLQSNKPDFCRRVASLAAATRTQSPDQMIDSGLAAPGLPVRLGEPCRVDARAAEAFGRSVAEPSGTAGNVTLEGVRTVSTSE